ncbi:hypothetical protein PCL_05350 [Purpureocillium lilacinum]|uniref:DDHD domain-containing protein n=1 Tax=Purpureocillium lilacinum TaxID=33203 RepID=A0A2U3DV54_PURLI|nr:hypothetical protein PCL_05350 [Purpureocillium lilacinum]
MVTSSAPGDDTTVLRARGPRALQNDGGPPGTPPLAGGSGREQQAGKQIGNLPPVKPSAIALGTAFNHGIELAVLSPIFGQTYQRAKTANTKEEFLRSKEASGAAAAWGTSFVGAALQSYGVGALINATGTLSYKGAAYLGGLIFAATAAPTFLAQIFSEKRPLDTVGVSVAAKLFETVGLSIFLTWWGTRTNPFD